MYFEFKHNQPGKKRAVAHIQTALMQARSQLPKEVTEFTDEWNDNVLSFSVTVQGQRITGTLAVTEMDYVVDTKLPLMMRMFEGKLQKMIEAEAAKHLSS